MSEKNRIKYKRIYLEQLRKAHKLTMNDIANEMRVARQGYQQLEYGLRLFSYPRMAELFDLFSEIFGVSVADLIAMEAQWLAKREEYIKNLSKEKQSE